jgi:rhamnosyltransferase
LTLAGGVRDVRNVGSVVVFFNPAPASIELANRLAEHTCCVVVDNTPNVRSQPGLATSVHYVANAENIGVASAVNRGVEVLLRAGCTSALLFDQDSDPAADLLEGLPALLDELKGSEKVALVAPAYDDARLGGVASFVRFRPFRLERVPATGDQVIETDFVITSGSCVNLECWAEVGPMDDALFIDFVDLEWCVRARRAGYKLLGVPWIVMSHSLGEEPVRLFGRPYPMHSPLRHYYLFRNAVALMRRSYVPWTWKSTELVKLPVRLLVYACLPDERIAHLRMALRGICDGLRGRLGRL